MEFLSWLLILAAVTVVLVTFPYLITWLSLSFMRLQPLASRPLAAAEIPNGLQAAASEVELRLRGLGFERLGAMASRSLMFDCPEDVISLVFAQPDGSTLATVTLTPYPGALRLFEVSFYSRLPNDRVLQTSDCFDHQIFQLPPSCISQDGYYGDLDKQWRLHTQRLNLNPADCDEWTPLALPEASLAAAVAWLDEGTTETFQYWLRRHIILRLYSGVYYLNPVYSARFTNNFVKAQRLAAQRVGQAPEPASSAHNRLLLEQQLVFRKTSNPISKALLLVLSMLAFYLGFGLMLSWTMVPMLVVVLLVHEYGHLWAMRRFGYQNTQIFFLPFLGAVTTGNKADPSVWQEVIVFLAGPVPGIALGAGLLLSPWAEAWPWLHEFALLCLILNVVNLLPLLPLDGGRVVEKLVFARYPAARTYFYCLSAGCFGLAAWYTRDPLLTLLALLTGWMALGNWRGERGMARIRARLADLPNLDPEQRKHDLFTVLSQEKLTPTERLAYAKDALSSGSSATPARATMVSGMLLYSILLAGSCFGMAHALDRPNYEDDEYYSASYWRESIALADSTDADGWQTTLSAIETISSGPNPDDAQEFISSAEQLASRWSQPDLRLAQWRLLQPVVTGAELTLEDSRYISDNALQDPKASAYDRVNVLDSMLQEAASLLSVPAGLALIEQALALLDAEAVSDPDLSAKLHWHAGKYHLLGSNNEGAVAQFALGFRYEQSSDYPLFDNNYEALLEVYFIDEDYAAALVMIETQLAAVRRYISAQPEDLQEYSQHALHQVEQQQGWFQLLSGRSKAIDTFAALLPQYRSQLEHEAGDAGYDQQLIALILDNIISSQAFGRDSSGYLVQLQAIGRDHLDRFIAGCKCTQRSAFDTYRHERYLQILRELQIGAVSATAS